MAFSRLSTQWRRLIAAACIAIFCALAFSSQTASAGTGSISGTVFFDGNDNGILDSGEAAGAVRRSGSI